jgi:hypothetical protein
MRQRLPPTGLHRLDKTEKSEKSVDGPALAGYQCGVTMKLNLRLLLGALLLGRAAVEV